MIILDKSRSSGIDGMEYAIGAKKGVSIYELELPEQLAVLFTIKGDFPPNELINIRLAIKRKLDAQLDSNIKSLIHAFLSETKSLKRSALICSVLSEKYSLDFDAFGFDQCRNYLKNG